MKQLYIFSIFSLLMLGSFSLVKAQTLGPFVLYDYLASAVHPNGCNDAQVTNWPQDSIWVNFNNGQVMTGTFNLQWVDQPGDDILLETGFHAANYSVRLMLQGGGFSAAHAVAMADWTFNMNVDWKYLFTSCGTSTITARQEYYLPLDFSADFGLSLVDVVVGIEITFLTTAGSPDFAGTYIIQPPVLLQNKFTAFEAKAIEDRMVELDWQLELEFDMAIYEVQRSRDGSEWTSVAQLPSRGNSPVPVSYMEMDMQPLRGYSYYRLKMTDKSGQESLSEVRAVYLTDESASVQIAPNPASGHVQVLNVAVPFDYIIYNSLGQAVERGRIVSGNQIAIDHLAAGMYQLAIEREKQRSTLKLIKK